MMKVAFYKHHRPGIAGRFDALIRSVSRGPYSHCELIFPDGMAYSASLMDGGCRFKKIDFDPAKWDFIDLSNVNSWAIDKFCIDETDCDYDTLGAFRFLCPWFHESKEKWFCSEICTAALQQAGMLPGVNAWQVTPVRLHQLLTEAKG